MLFLCPQWSCGPYISRNFLIWTHFVNASWKKSDLRMHISSTTQGINVVKVRFTMRYSSGKLSNGKVITTACNFWRQIACSFRVVSGNILFLGSKIFEIPPFFQTRPGDLGKKVHACSIRFSALKLKTVWSGRKFQLRLEKYYSIRERVLRSSHYALRGKALLLISWKWNSFVWVYVKLE